MKENERALLLVGPQYIDETRPMTAGVSRIYEHVNALGILIVSAFLRQRGIKRTLLPMEPGKMGSLERHIEEAGVVFISVRHFDTGLAQEAILMANRHHRPTVVGGYGPTFNPSAFEGATSRVLGEAEPALDQLMEDLLWGNLQPIYNATSLPPFDLSHYVWPDRSISFRSPFTQLTGLKRESVELQRGCRNKCIYCSPTRLQRGGVRIRKPGDFFAEVEAMGLRDGDFIFFPDNDTTAIPSEEFREILRWIKNHHLRFVTEGTVASLLEDLDKNGEEGSILNLMSAKNGTGGCYGLLYGADDFAVPKVPGSQDKEIKLLGRAVSVFRHFAIPLNISIVIGLDNHRYPETFFQIASILKEAAASVHFFHIATPYLGTTWGDKVYGEGRVFENNFTRFNHRQVVFEPRGMAIDQLQQGYYWLQGQLSSPQTLAQIARRNISNEVLQRNPLLACFLSGLPWGMKNYLSILELSARGYIDPRFQKELDEGFKAWQSR